MPAEWFDALESVLRRLKTLADADPALREDLRSLARATLTLSGEETAGPVPPRAEAAAEAAEPAISSPTHPAAERVPAAREHVRVELPRLTLGQSLNGSTSPADSPSATSDSRTFPPRGWAPITDDDLP